MELRFRIIFGLGLLGTAGVIAGLMFSSLELSLGGFGLLLIAAGLAFTSGIRRKK